MEAFLVSTGLVVLAEIGDKTQLLALLLAARYRRPLPIILGILVATALNHFVAAWAGDWVSARIPLDWFPWIVGGLFIAVGAWTLIPDKFEDEHPGMKSMDAFVATAIAFFIAEIGDKTQIATIILAAKYQALAIVVTATTLGVLLANIPSVLLGDWLHDRLPLRPIRIGAALLFAVTGIWTIVAGV